MQQWGIALRYLVEEIHHSACGMHNIVAYSTTVPHVLPAGRGIPDPVCPWHL